MSKAIAVFAVVAAVAMSWIPGAQAKSYKAGNITVENPWARATSAMAKSGGAFLTIANAGIAADKLIAVKSRISRRSGLHRTLTQDGIMKMRRVGAIEVPAGGRVMLKPGGYHVMFTGLKKPLKEGASFALTLVFERAGEIEVMVKVMKAGARSGMKMKRAN